VLNDPGRVEYSDNGASRVFEKTDNAVCSVTGTDAD